MNIASIFLFDIVNKHLASAWHCHMVMKAFRNFFVKISMWIFKLLSI